MSLFCYSQVFIFLSTIQYIQTWPKWVSNVTCLENFYEISPSSLSLKFLDLNKHVLPIGQSKTWQLLPIVNNFPKKYIGKIVSVSSLFNNLILYYLITILYYMCSLISFEYVSLLFFCLFRSWGWRWWVLIGGEGRWWDGLLHVLQKLALKLSYPSCSLGISILLLLKPQVSLYL